MAIEPKAISKPTGLAICGLCALLLLWSVGTAGVAFFANRFDEGMKPAFFLGGFELIVAVAAALGLWLGWKRREEYLGMALACLGGTISVASFLGALSVQYDLMGFGLKPIILIRLVLGLALCGFGAAAVLSRHERSWPLFWKGVLIASPIIALAGYAVVTRLMMRAQAAALPASGPDAPMESAQATSYSMMGPLEHASTAVQGIVLSFIAIVCGVSLCACVHVFIKAFELGRFSRERIILPRKK